MAKIKVHVQGQRHCPAPVLLLKLQIPCPLTILQEDNYCVIVISLGKIISLAMESSFLEFVCAKVLINPEKVLRNVSKLV